MNRSEIIVGLVGILSSMFLVFSIGFHSGQTDIKQEALDVGAAELYDNYQTMNQEFRWVVVDKPKDTKE